jgi:hypothetical protein
VIFYYLLLAADIFGSGHGLDHVGIAVHDLKRAENTFRDLGFTVSGRGWLPDGVIDSSIEFTKQDQYLELIQVTDRQKASLRQNDLVEFSDKGEGPFFIGLDVSSAKKTAATLRRNGWTVDGPAGNSWTPEGVTEQFPEGWLRVRIGLPIFFLEYRNERLFKQLEKKYPQIKENPNDRIHANGATGIAAAWIAVSDLAASTRSYERAGLAPGRRLRIDPLDMVVQEMKASAGAILVVAAASRRNPIAPRLEKRDESVIGVTLEVPDLTGTRRNIEPRLHADPKEYDGAFGRCILIPAEFAFDTYIEFCQKKGR